ncbi:TetR/AcrR family transcriptional regulator [Bradyrhizobium genosp. A]|uniref:TetR/AcrR family transcriptional regulator n=1 Tax=Bradyrhizobium genosp. A TaxID=83626 RepID=UPI003CED9808
MKVSKAQATENRGAIVHAAARQIRERGFDQVSVADVARAAGLTHGALYSHFTSKETLQAEATREAFKETLAAFTGLSSEEFLRRYLSPQHRDSAAVGCPNAALVSEIWRQPEETQQAFLEGLLGFINLTSDTLGSDAHEHSRDRAVTVFATLVGGLALSRAIRDVDRAVSDDILRAIASQIKSLIGSGRVDGKAATGNRPAKGALTKGKL